MDDIREKIDVIAICNALIAIVNTECCTYSFDDEVNNAEKLIERYDEIWI